MQAAITLVLMLVQALAMLPIAGLIQQVFDRGLPAGDTGLMLGDGVPLFTLNALAAVAMRQSRSALSSRASPPGPRSDAARNLLARERGFFAAADLDGLRRCR